MNKSHLRVGLLASSALIGLSIAGGAHAQTGQAAAQPAPQEVVVTGSRIPRAGFDTLQPAETLSAETVQDRGFTNIADALNELPAFGGTQNIGEETGSQAGEKFVDLYSLGSQRTLVLVDGRRFVSGYAQTTVGTFGGAPAGQEVDLNTIPVGLVDHVEVVSVGGAPVYGADAIAGTVNIILKKNFQGAQVEADYGVSALGDGRSYIGRGLVGTNFADDRGNVTVSVEYTQQDGLTNAARPRWLPYDTQQPSTACTALGYGACLVNPATVASLSANGVPALTSGLANSGSTSGYPAAVKNSAGQPVAFDANGNLVPYNFGIQNNGGVFAQGGDGLGLANENQLLPSSTRVLLDTISHYDITPHVTAYLETEYSHLVASQTGQSFYSSALFASQAGDGPIPFSITNPYLTPADVAILQATGQTNFYLSKSNLDLGNQGVQNENDTFRIVPGIKGDFRAFDRKINWDIAFNYGRSQSDISGTTLNLANFENAINVISGPSGPECAVTATPPALPAGSSKQPQSVANCVPLDIFGANGPSNAAKAFVEAPYTNVAVNTERDVQINVNGSPFDIWAGPVQVAAGFEYRQESGSYSPDALLLGGLEIGGSAASGVAGSYDSKEFYFEGTVPLLSPKFNLPWAYSAEFDGSIREIDNSYAGTNDVFTLGLKYAPVRDLEFRGNITHSVRAPSIEELFLPTAFVQSFAQDPCDPNYISGLTPNRAANCAKAFAALGTTLAAAGPGGTAFKSNVVNASVLGQTSGSQQLQNEVANSWTAGFVLRPHWVPRLSIALDWVNIHLKDPITSLSLTQVMDACYDAPVYPNPFCSLFTRSPVGSSVGAGQITGYNLPLENLGAELFSGAQLQSTYNVDVGKLPYIQMVGLKPGEQYGNLAFDMNAFFLNEQNQQILGVVTKLRGDIGYSKWKVNGGMRYRLGRFMVYLNGRWISSADSNVQLQRSSQQLFGVGNYWVWNTAVSYDITQKITGELTVNNLFNQGPPKNAGLLGGNLALATYDYFGQAFVFKLKAKF